MKRLPVVALSLGAALAVAAFTPTVRAAAPASPLAAPPLVLPVPAERTLANGLRVVVFTQPRLPIVQVQLLVPAGASAEPDSVAGLAALTALMLPRGTASRTASQFAADANAIGATITTSAGRDDARIACGVRASAFEAALELMADAALGPRFDDEAYADARRQVAQDLGRRRQTIADIVEEGLWDSAFGPHPYAHRPAGDIQALVATSLETIRAFHRSRWRPDRAVLAIAGDIEPERAFKAAGESFGRWGGRTSADPARVVPRANPPLRIVDLPGSEWTEARVAVRGPGRASPELASWQLAAASLAGSLAPAGVRVTFTSLRDASLLALSAGTPSDSAAALVRRLRLALTSFAAHPPAGAELEAMRRRVAQSAPLSIETLGALLSQWQTADEAGLPADALAREYARLASPAALGDASAAARAIAQGPLVTVVAGPGESLRRSLAALGPLEVVPFERKIIGPPATLPEPTALELQRGSAAVAAAILAHGGAAKLAAVHTLVTEGNMTLHTGTQDVSGQFSLVRVDPARLSYATKMLQFESRQVLDGDAAWSLAMADTVSLTDVDSTGVAALRALRENDLVHVLRAAGAPGSRAALRGHELIGGHVCDFVDFRGPGGHPMRLAVERLTHHVLAIDDVLSAGPVWRDRHRLSNFKLAGGVLLPLNEERSVDGEQLSAFRASINGVNPPLDDGLFRKPRVLNGQIVPSQ